MIDRESHWEALVLSPYFDVYPPTMTLPATSVLVIQCVCHSFEAIEQTPAHSLWFGAGHVLHILEFLV